MNQNNFFSVKFAVIHINTLIFQGKGTVTTYWLTGERAVPVTSVNENVAVENPPNYNDIMSEK